MQRQTRVIFYSWQSDLPNASNRGLIGDALQGCADELRKDQELKIDPVVDRDTLGRPGSPDIATTILDKILMADMFVADVSLITPVDADRRSPNPNVLVELGFAIAAKGWERVVMVMNTFYGKPSDLPFDLRSRRVITYSCDGEPGFERSGPRRGLQASLIQTLRDVLGTMTVGTANREVEQRELVATKSKEVQAARLIALSKDTSGFLTSKLLCVHVVPASALDPTYQLDVGEINDQRTYAPPMGTSGYNSRYNGNGLFRSNDDPSGKIRACLQVFRSGVVESINSEMMDGSLRGRGDGLPSLYFAKALVEFLERVRAMYIELQVRAPYSIRVALLGASNVNLLMAVDDVYAAYTAHPLGEDPLFLPEIVLESGDSDVKRAIKAALDVLWQHAGARKSSCYDQAGNWILR